MTIPGERTNDDARRRRNHHLIGIAHKILFSRAAFRQVLPSHVTHDPRLEALLVQDEQCMRSEAFDAAMKAIGGSTRWKTALEQLGFAVTSPDYVMLSEHGRGMVLEGLTLVLDAQARTP